MECPVRRAPVGTDHVGRDIFARRALDVSLMIGLCSTLIALFFGAIIGSIAAVVRKSASENDHARHGRRDGGPGIAMAFRPGLRSYMSSR